jgi:WD40 repeat protein
MKIYFFIIAFAFFSADAQTPELLVQLGHSERVKCIDYNHDGSYLISGGNDNVIKLWQVANGLVIRTFQGHRGLVYDIEWGRDEKNIFSCSWDDRRIIKWDIATGKILNEFRFPKDAATKIAVSDDGKFLGAACGNGGAVLFNAADLSVIKKFDVKETGFINFSNDGKVIYITSKGYGSVKMQAFEIASGNKINEMPIFAGVGSVSISGNSMLASNYEKISLYDLASFKEIFTEKKILGKVSSSALSLDEKYIAVGMESGSIEILDRKGLPVKGADGNIININREHYSQVNDLEFSPAGDFICTASNDWTLKVFNTSNGKIVRNLRTQSEYLQGTSLNADGNLLAFSSGNIATGNNIGVWDLLKGKIYPVHKGKASGLPFTGVAFTPKGKTIAAAGRDGKINYWDFPSGNRGDMAISGSPVTCVTYTPNGKNIISGTKDGKLIIWRPDRNSSQAIESDKSGIASVAVSPDGILIAAGTYDGKVLIYSYETKELLRSIESHTQLKGYSDTSYVMAYGSVTSFSLDGSFAALYASIMSVAFSPDSKTVAACGGNWINFFDATSGTITKKINQYGAGFVNISYSHDGKMLCSAGADFIVRTWDVTSGNVIHTLRGHQNEVRAVQFSNSDRFLISGSIDTQVKLWDLKNNKELLSFIIVEGGNDYIISNPQGYYFATKGASKILSFRIGNKVFPFEQFDLKYNRPDIIFSDLSIFTYSNANDNPNVPLVKSYYAAYKKRLKRSGFTEEQVGSELHIPEISFLKKDIPLVTKDPKLEFSIHATDDKYNLKNINVWVNDVPVYGAAGLPVNAKEVDQKCTVILSGERNKITISCRNDKGAESYKENVEITYQGGIQNYKVYYVGIGISNYKDPDFNLRYSVKDINDFSAAIRSRYPDADITLLTDEKAIKENILRVKEKLLKTTVNDKVIISLSGHGLLSKELDFYYATYDIDFHHPEGRGLLYEDLENILEGIPARNKLLLVDACHSGEVDKEEKLTVADQGTPVKGVNVIAARGVGTLDEGNSIGLDNSFELMQEVFSDLNKGNGAVVISAAGGREYALESAEWNNGVFTFSVLDGLKNNKADLDNNSKISVTELKKFVSESVQRLTAGKQKPTSRRDNLENDWDIW